MAQTKIPLSQLDLTGFNSGREKLSANRIYYVRTDGNDTNNGLANTAGGAFLTIQKAIDTTAALDLSIYDVTIQIADGTYTGAVVLKSTVGAGRVIIQGNSTIPANVVISTTSNNAFFASALIGAYTLKAFKVQTTTSGSCVYIEKGSALTVDGLNFGACASVHVILDSNSYLSFASNYTISGGAAYHVYSSDSSAIIYLGGITVTLIGTPAFSAYFAFATDAGAIRCIAVTFSGAATGQRFYVTNNGVINTSGAALNYFPGSIAGLQAFGGVYDGLGNYAGRETLTANRTYFVRTDGSDLNSGLANTAGGAFLTVQKAIDTVATLDLAIYDVVIQIADGTYTGALTLKALIGAGSCTIRGNTSTPTNVFINPTASHVVAASGVKNWILDSFRLVATTGGSGIYASAQSYIKITNLIFGAFASGNYHMFADQSAIIEVIGNYAITGPASAHFLALWGGHIICTSKTITITGTPTFGTAFAQVTRQGKADLNGNTYSGSASGSRYLIDIQGLVFLNGAAGTTLPGSTAGTVTAATYGVLA